MLPLPASEGTHTVRSERFAAIRRHLYGSGFSSVDAIASAVGASPATVRRDLLALEAEGSVTRIHGGARIAESAGLEVAFELREQHWLPAKRAIAEAVYAGIAPNGTLFLDAGTTVLQVARCIRLNPRPLSVFTNCLIIADVLKDVPAVRVTLIGGHFRPENMSTVGSLAEDMLDRLWFDTLLLGAGAVAEDCSIYSLDEEEARLNAKMLDRAARKLLLVDASKFGARLTYKVVPLKPDLGIVTDDRLDGAWRKRLADIGCTPKLVHADIARQDAA